MILGLDLSKRSTGWAYWDGKSDMPSYGTWTLGSEYTSDGGTYLKLHERLEDLRSLCRFEHIYFEDPIHPAKLQGGTNIASLRVLAGLAAHAESYGEARSCRTVMRVNNSSWRAQFIGKQPRGTKRQSLKDLAMQRCRQLGFAPRKDDEADALGLLDYGCAMQGIIPPWRFSEVLRPPLGVSA